ncbi:MAG: hypothetical protein NC818_05640 [Candidatus Omnitrophica bacterium]|nr:hypothetical protein [Candidatus Omnitrophota bacterium]
MQVIGMRIFTSVLPLIQSSEATKATNPFLGDKEKYLLPIPKGGIESLLPKGLRVISQAFVPAGVNPAYKMWEIFFENSYSHQTGTLHIDTNRGIITPVDQKRAIAGAVIGFRLDLNNFPELAQAKYFAFYVYPNSDRVNLDLEFTFSQDIKAQGKSQLVSPVYFTKRVLMGRLPNPLKEEDSPRLVVVDLDKLRKFSQDKLSYITISFNNGPWDPSRFRDDIPAVLSDLVFIGAE